MSKLQVNIADVDDAIAETKQALAVRPCLDTVVNKEKLAKDVEANMEEHLTKKARKGQLRFAQEAEVSAILGSQEDEKIVRDAKSRVDMLFSNRDKQSKTDFIDNFGKEAVKSSLNDSEMLKTSVRDLMKHGDMSKQLGDDLVEIALKVEDLDPTDIDFSPGWFARHLGFIPLFGKPLKKYFIKFESSQTMINSIVTSIKKGKEQLRRDNITLRQDQEEMYEAILELRREIKIGQLMKEDIENRLTELKVRVDQTTDQTKADELREQINFVETELLNPLNQKIIDLQQLMTVNQQGVMADEILIRNNRELIRGCDRVLTVTVNALRIAVQVAVALNHQRIVLDKIQIVNEKTVKMIANTSRMLKTQGVEIHKLASGAILDMNVLKQAFVDLNSAVDDINTYKIEANKVLDGQIREMDDLIEEGNKSIERMRKGSVVQANLDERLG